jgi:hypothetical protein
MRETVETWAARFLSRCEPDPDSECILYTGSLNNKGYGVTRVHPDIAELLGLQSNIARAHRVMYVLIRGVIMQGEVLDHLCNTRACVNAYHTSSETVETNALRATITQNYGVSSWEQAYGGWETEQIY